MSKVIENLIRSMDIHPVLIDIGSTGSPPKIWKWIYRYSTYVGFDPDSRAIDKSSNRRFHKKIIVNKAITSDKKNEGALFYFTKSPYCSSTLKPDADSLSSYLFSDLFTVEKEERVPAVTLDSVMDDLSLSKIDWLKTDSQGTDLRIFTSLREAFRSRVLAIDIEPGLIDGYIGEDLFVDAHRYLTQNGFWLSDLNICGAVRMRRSTMREVMGASKKVNASKGVKESPAWCEARYLKDYQVAG